MVMKTKDLRTKVTVKIPPRRAKTCICDSTSLLRSRVHARANNDENDGRGQGGDTEMKATEKTTGEGRLTVIPFENWRQFPLSVPGFHFSKPNAFTRIKKWMPISAARKDSFGCE
jgi:hypothetical protein